MARVLLDGEHLQLEELWQISKNKAQVVLDKKALHRVNAAREVVEKAVAEGKVIYGVTTGFGKLSNVQISAEHTSQLQLNLLRSHACGVGPGVSTEIVRAVMALKLNNLLRGYSGVRQELILHLQEILNRGVHPFIPSKGSVGASGDLAPLAHMSLVLIGEGIAEYQGRQLSGKEALEAAGLEPITLAAKEGLSLINGTQYMTASLSLAVYRAMNLVKTADIIASMTIDGMKGTPVAFEPQVHEIRNQEGQKRTARNILALMAGSEIRQSHLECKKVQDAYAIRCIPQVHGASRDAISYVCSIVNRELNAVTDNPLVFVEDDKIISGGNFHGAPVAMAADFLAIAVAELASISERRIAMMMDSTYSELPDFLSPKPGLNSGLMIAHVTSAALVSQNKTLCHPASVDSIPTSANKEDHVSMGANAVNKLAEVLENTERVLAIEAICAGQTIDLRAPLQPGKGVAIAHNLLRNKIPFLDHDRILSEDLEQAYRLVVDFVFPEYIEKKLNCNKF